MSPAAPSPAEPIPASPNGVLRVLLVDDHSMVRSGFAMVLGTEGDLLVVGQASNGAEAIEQTRALSPDIVLMDVQMPVMDGIEATRVIVAEAKCKVIILTTFDRDDYLFDGLIAGASGFLLKNADPDDLIEAVRAVGHGHALLAPEVTRRVIERMAGDVGHQVDTPARAVTADQRLRLARLTQREHEVLTAVAQGRSNAEIATEMFLGEATVKTHVSNCLAKLGVRDRVQAVVFAYEAGIIRPGR